MKCRNHHPWAWCGTDVLGHFDLIDSEYCIGCEEEGLEARKWVDFDGLQMCYGCKTANPRAFEHENDESCVPCAEIDRDIRREIEPEEEFGPAGYPIEPDDACAW